MHNISVTPKMAKKFIAKLIHQRQCGTGCIPVDFLKNCEPEPSYILANKNRV